MPLGEVPESFSQIQWVWIPGWFLTFLGIIGNAMVIYLIATKRRLRTQINVFILSLAVADLCFSLSYFPAFFTCEFYLTCDRQLRKIFAAYFAYTSLTNLCVLTADRFVAIVMPFKYVSFVTSRCVVTMVILSWLFPAVFYFLVAVTLKQIASEDTMATFGILTVFLFQLVPCFSLLLGTTQMFYIAHKHSRKMTSLVSQVQFNHPLPHRKQKDGFEISSARLVGLVVFVLVVCYTTDSYFDLRTNFSSFHKSLVTDYVICLLYITNSAINPISYALLKHDIKKEVKRLLFRKRKLNRGKQKSITTDTKLSFKN